MSWPKPNKEVINEIEEMNAGDFPEPASLTTDAPSTDAPSTDPPEDFSTEAPSTESPSTDAPSTEAPSTEAPTTDAPVEEDDLEHFRKELEDVLSSKVTVEKKEEKAPTTDPPIEEVNFLEKLGIDPDAEITPEVLNKAVNSAYQMAKEDISKQPSVDPQSIIQEQMQIVEVNRKFYEKHPDLAKYRNFVSKVAADLREKMSDEDKTKLELGEFLDRAADEARKKLRLKINEKKEEVKKEKEKNKPKFPKTKGQKGSKKSKDKLSPLEGEIDEMNNALA